MPSTSCRSVAFKVCVSPVSGSWSPRIATAAMHYGQSQSFAVEYNAARRRAGILSASNQVVWMSNDLAARAATSPPWAVYLLAPEVCAGLIVDMSFYMVVGSDMGFVDALQAAGIRAECI